MRASLRKVQRVLQLVLLEEDETQLQVFVC